MADKKDDRIIDLTEVVEEAPGPAVGSWMESSPPPAPEKKAPEPPPVPPGKEPIRIEEELRGIPDSPLKKFILAEEETSIQAPPPQAKVPQAPVFSTPPRISPEPVKPAAGPRFPFPETPRPAPEQAHLPPESVRSTPEPPRPPALNVEAELRTIREAMLSRVERWVSQEGVQVLERVAREIFPKIAEEVLRKEIEKMKAEAEERE